MECWLNYRFCQGEPLFNALLKLNPKTRNCEKKLKTQLYL